MSPYSAGIDWKAGVTVQVLASGQNPMSKLWGHNLEDKIPSNIARFKGRPKPEGWGNLGGGLEKRFYVPSLDRWFDSELDFLEFYHPGHPILSDDSLSQDTKIILACGLREFIHETGYRDVEIRTDYRNEYGEPFLFDYYYTPDKETGLRHRVVTIWGEVKSFIRQEALEKEEVDKTEWFDLSKSLFKPFFNSLRFPGRPYWSHNWRLLMAIKAVDQHYRHEDLYAIQVDRYTHPSWKIVYRVGGGDPRFPIGGYRPPPWDWYKLFDKVVKNRMEMADNDFIFDLFGTDITNTKRYQEEKLEAEMISSSSPDAPTESIKYDEDGLMIEGSEDSSRYPTPAEIIEKEDREYGEWLEMQLGI